MGIKMLKQYNLGDKLLSKKPHPCGSNHWKMINKGADYKLECVKCGHHIIVDYDTLIKKFKQIDIVK